MPAETRLKAVLQQGGTPTMTLPYRLLAIDIDGTLVGRGDEISPANREALHRARQAGLRVVLATGRRYSRTLPLVEPLQLDVPLVTGTGALIKDPHAGHRTLFRAAFADGALLETLAVVASAGFEAVLYADTFHEGFDFYCSRLEGHRPELADYLAKNPGCGRVWPGAMTQPPEGIFAGFAMGTRDEMLALARTLQADLHLSLETHVLRSPFYSGFMCELLPGGVSKWSGILRLAAQWGIAPEEIAAIGDDVNDIPMIAGAGLGVAVENAPPEVQAVARRVAPRHDADAVAAVVEWILDEGNNAP